MAKVLKQDSNFTDLRFAVETSPGVVAADTVWFPLEPNDYKDFGGSYKTKARNPINPSRQRKKGVIVDLDAGGHFSSDVTPSNVQSIAETFMFAVLRTKHELAIPSVNGGTNAYVPASGGDGYFAGDLLFAKGLQLSPNDGLKVVSGTPGATSVTVSDTGLVDEAGSAGIISYVGHQFGATTVSVDVSGNFPVLVGTSVGASKVLTMADVFVNGDTITIGTVTYTMQSALTNLAGHVKIGADTAASLVNLRNAINRNGSGVPGTDFAALCVANPDATATATSTTLTATARWFGAPGNAVTIGEVSTNGSWAGAAILLSGGTGYSFKTLGTIPGEPIFIGGDTPGTDAFTPAENNGFCRVRSVDNNALTLDKTAGVMVTDAGTGVTLRIFTGRVLKNESVQALIHSKSVQLERTLGAPDDSSPTEIQAEYITRCLGDELDFDAKSADIFTAGYKFLGGTHETRDGPTGVKSGSRPDIVETDAFNTTSDLSLLKMAIVFDDDSCPLPLFGFLTDYKLVIKNNLKQNKALSVLGAIGVTAGTFMVTVDVTAYFSDITAIAAVRDNRNVTFEAHNVKANRGFSMDLPLVVLGKSLATVKQDAPITLPMSADAATAALITPSLNHTLLMVFWDYLPDAAG